jgi:alkanesulfonate monooxygenase SsuD/methylene tetrahydromethanopterin reductase-like flavin-dependent oxidoreductase (luciferase family)
MMAVLAPEGIYHCAKRGFHIQTTPLAGGEELMAKQVDAFCRGRDESARTDLTLSLSVVAFAAANPADGKDKIAQAHDYYRRFDNVFTGPGVVENGMIAPLPRKQTAAELADNVLICPPAEMTDKLSRYAEAGIDRAILNVNFGASQRETLDCIQRFAEEVMPHFADDSPAESSHGAAGP